VVACSGTFAKDSSHLELATAFNSKNITFTDVESSDGSPKMSFADTVGVPRMDRKTDSKSPGELEMTRSTSEVAVLL
jgi:hypothetical protein